MKKSITILPLLCCASFSVFAKSYLNLGYGVSVPSTDQQLVFTGIEEVYISPDTSDSVWSITLGYGMGNNTSIEMAYSQFNGDTELEKPATVSGSVVTTYDYQVNMKAEQFSITPVYHTNFGKKISIKGGMGVTYTHYEFSGSTSRELNGNDAGPIPGAIVPSPQSDKKWGVNATVGADYLLLQGLTIGVQANYSYDNVASHKSVLGTVGFRF